MWVYGSNISKLDQQGNKGRLSSRNVFSTLQLEILYSAALFEIVMIDV